MASQNNINVSHPLTATGKSNKSSLYNSETSQNIYSTGKDKTGMTIKEEILGNRKHIINIICMTWVWISASFGYSLISFELKYIRGDVFANGISSSSSECVAYIISGFLLKKFGLRITLSWSYFLAMVGMVGIIFTDTDTPIWPLLFVLTSRFGVSIAFNTSLVGNYQLFPVTIVATTMGICNSFSRICTIFAPYVAEFKPDEVA